MNSTLSMEWRRPARRLFLILIPAVLMGCEEPGGEPLGTVKSDVDALIQLSGEEVAVSYQDLETGDSPLINPDVRMHAASTMKVPVMIQLFQDRADGLLPLDETLEVITTFTSIVDGSPYSLSPGDDSATDLYEMAGEEVTHRHLIDLMITVSSNLATNLLVEGAGADRVTASMRALGADSIMVLRGVEDGPAFRAGLSHTTTARDLGIILSAMCRGEVVSSEASHEMVARISRRIFDHHVAKHLSSS